MQNKIAFNLFVQFGTKVPQLLAVFTICVFAWHSAAAQNRAAAPGAGGLDPTFTAGVTEASAGLSMVFTAAGQTDGKILVGGSFAYVNSVPRTNLARLNADGTLDEAFNQGGAGLDAGDLRDIVVQPDGKILIAGLFGSYNGTPRQNIARLNADGSLDTTFNSGAGPNSTTFAIALQADGKILISGNFTIFNGTPRGRIARLNADGSLDTTFAPGTGSNQPVYSIAVQPDGKILIGGNFTSINGTARGRIARLNADGTLDATFNPVGAGANSGVQTIAVQPDGKILFGGFFQTYNGVSRNQIARLNTDGTLDSTFNLTAFPPNPTTGLPTSYVYSIDLQADGKILAAGYFGYTGNTDGRPVVRINTNGTLDTTFTTGISNSQAYETVQQSNGKIFLGGGFTQFAGAERIKTAQVNSNGTLDAAFPAVNFTGIALVRAIARQADGKILVGGNFRMANGILRRGIARFNHDGSVDAGFNQTGFGADNDVTAIGVQPDGKIVIGGNFDNYNGTPRRGLARLNADGTLDATFSTAFVVISTEEIVPQSDGKILIAGLANPTGFSSVVYRLNSDGSLDNSFEPANATGSAQAIAIQPDGKILVGGFFTFINNTARNRIARLNSDGTLDAAFNPGTGANQTIYDIALQPDGKILLGGFFTTYNGANRTRIARINPDSSLDTTFNPGTGITGSVVYSLVVQPDGKILVGGSFSAYNGVPRNDLAQLNADGSLDSSFDSGFSADGSSYVFRLLPQPDGKILVGGRFTNYAGVPRNSLLRLQSSSLARQTLFDFDGDGKADQTVFRPSDRVWYLLRSSSGFAAAQFGDSTDRIAPADFDGDGRTDIAVFRDGVWYWLNSSNGNFNAYQFGSASDTPVPFDYTGDGRAELAVYRGGVWYALNLANNQFQAVQFGASSDKPVPADFDGDGKTDIAVYRDGTWYWLRSSDGGFRAVQFGIASDKPVVGDYDGDGRADQAVYRSGVWYVLGSTQGFYAVQFGFASDIPVAADYDGDGKTDVAVFRGDTWYLLRSQQGFGAVQFGTTNDRPIPAAFAP